MRTLHNLFPAIVPNYALVFCLRFDLLVYRARLVWIRDSFRVARYLAALEDSSHEVQRLANVLRGNAIAEGVRYFTYARQSIELASTAPCLEVEFRLVQSMIKIVTGEAVQELKNVGGFEPAKLWTQLSRASADDAVEEPLQIFASNPPNSSDCVSGETDRSSCFMKEHSKDSLETAITLCKQYPTSSGRFLSLAKELKHYAIGSNPTNLPRMYSLATKLGEKAWGNHMLGQLETCDRHHPYSGGSFPEGCPECGRKVELPEVEFARNSDFLHEDKFLEQMRRCEPSRKSSNN